MHIAHFMALVAQELKKEKVISMLAMTNLRRPVQRKGAWDTGVNFN